MSTEAPPAPTAARRSRAPLVAMVVVILGLLLTAQERTFGSITDEQQAIGTAVAIAETGGLGLPRGFAFAVPRERGDALSPYGLGMPLALLPACALAERWERAFGAGSSQSLLILVPLALVALAAWGAGLIARGLGAPPAGEILAVLGTGLASPLWPLGSTAFSEPLQAAALAGAVAAALLGARAAAAERERRASLLAVVAGACAGLAILTKSMNLVVAPWCLVPLLVAPVPRRALRSALFAGLGAAPVLAAWLAAEIVRFGAPLSSYSGQPFSHPPLDGLWRLTVGPSEGLLLYFPLALLSLPALVALGRSAELRPALLAVGMPAATVLALVSAWWAWDGSAGWGPRLLGPLVPLLAGAAGWWAAARQAKAVAAALLAAGFALNALGLLQPDASILLYVDSCGSVLVAEEDVPRWPAGLAEQFPPGRRRVSRSMASVSDAAFAPVRVHASVFRRRLEDLTPEERLASLREHPPWQRSRPEARPAPQDAPGQLSGVLFNLLVSDAAWPHWGACLMAPEDVRRAAFVDAWLYALDDQVLRALDVGDDAAALRCAATCFAIAKHDRAASLLAESLRASGRPDDAERFLASLPERTQGTPEVLAVRALIARDRGLEAAARTLLGALAAAADSPGVRRARQAPLAEWPRTIRPLVDPAAPWH